MLETAIIGAGLAGLSLAAHLIASGQTAVALFEAGPRAGGRIACTETADGNPEGRFDLGPTWVWPGQQPQLQQFVQRHDIALFPQYQSGNALYLAARGQAPRVFPDPHSYAGAYRIRGGAVRLLEVLLPLIPAQQFYLRHQLLELVDRQSHVEMRFRIHGQLSADRPLWYQQQQGSHAAVSARRVVLCLPPRLLRQSIQFTPVLDDRFNQLLVTTPTWMAGHAKVIAQYDRPFWREAGLSGNAFAQYPGAILGEIFDACDAGGSYAALGAFFALPAPLRDQYRADLEALVLDQLGNLFGPQALYPRALHIRDWYREPGIAVADDAVVPNAHPDYGHPWLQLDHWNEKLWFAATETDRHFGGYLEGALRAAARVGRELVGTVGSI